MTHLNENLKNKERKENLINEYKGLLFEYLVGEKLAKYFDIVPQFLKSLPPLLVEKLEAYQLELISMESHLLRALPIFAEETVSLIKGIVPHNTMAIFLVGNVFGASRNESLSESDLYLLGENGSSLKISLKLCKWNSFVNTKNGGVQSFIEKYFLYPDAFTYQRELNDCLDESYFHLAQSLMKVAPEYQSELKLKKNRNELTLFFQNSWQEHYSHLPGELPEEMRPFVFDYYSTIIQKIYQILIRFFKEDRALFLKSLYPLLGFGHPEICQVNTFHHGGNVFKGVHIITFDDLLRELETLKIDEPKKGVSSFNIRLKNLVLQIRVKPMNSFLAKSPKINCSVKHLL